MQRAGFLKDFQAYADRELYLIRQRFSGTFSFIHINKCGGTSVEAALRIPVKIHDTALQRRRKVGRRRWERMFTFAVVRSPYSKVISHYSYRVGTDQTGLGNAHLDLNEWIVRAYGDRDPRYYDHALMFAPCRDWVVGDQGEVIIDHVAKLEELNREWPRICGRIGIVAELSHVNRTGWSRQPTELLDPASIRIVNDRFRADFDLFGYSQL